MKFKTGDKVIVIAGKNKGKQSVIVKIFADKNKVVIDGVNLKKKHKKAVKGEGGGVIEIPAPMDISNIAIVDVETNKASRVGFIFNKNGKKIRIIKKTGVEIK
ncbi:MAG: 50S ribosomal protein L24 [Candidatus Pacebacteria bacterium]|nr:50S ribosomal protein L24 [Candidatus Paceibacterota bacterium]